MLQKENHLHFHSDCICFHITATQQSKQPVPELKQGTLLGPAVSQPDPDRARPRQGSLAS